MKRNLLIDLIKGIATLSIIFIHTVFWSGERYVPSEIRNLSLYSFIYINKLRYL